MWDTDSCPLPPTLPGSSIAALIQRQKIRMQTACCPKSAVMRHVLAFGEFGNLAQSELAHALAVSNVQVVACGAEGTCPRGGVPFAMLQVSAHMPRLDLT